MHEPKEDRSSPRAEPCVELPLLMPSWQWAALERLADNQGLTVGQVLRRLVAAYFAEQDEAWAAADRCHLGMENPVAGHPGASPGERASPSTGECQ